MKETVHMKLEARNKRLKISMPVELYRSLQYRLEVTKKKQQQQHKDLFESEHPHQTTWNSLNPLPRGPIIQLDLRPKSAAYFSMLKRSDRLNKQTIDEAITMQKKNSDELENFAETIENLEELHFSDKYHYKTSKFAHNNKLKFQDPDRTNNKAMENLENRIKRWHLDFGANKACVARFNRIDIDVSRLYF